MSYSTDLRLKVLSSYESETDTQQEIVDTFQISLSTFKRWLRKKRSGKDIGPDHSGRGRHKRLKEVHFKKIKQLVEKNPSITLREISEDLAKKNNLVVGTSVLGRALQELNLRYKKLSIQAAEKQTDAIKKKGRTI